MEFLESLRRLEEDVENYDDFEQLPVHTALEKRFRNTLYLGKAAEGISLPVADVAVDLFQNAAEKNLGTFTRRHVAKFNRNGQINPSSSILGMMYARRLKRQKSTYLQKVSSTELFLVSMMLATKFLYDEGEDEEIFSDEWADSANMDVKKVNELEREFLEAINWDLFITPNEYYEFLQQMETWIALNEGHRRGWFSYSDLSVLMEHKDWYATVSSLLDTSMKAVGLCLAVYSLCSATLCWSLLVMQHHSTIPGLSLVSANHSHVFHGVRPLKATQVQSHQSEILLPPLQLQDTTPQLPDDNRPTADDRPLCPSCRQCCCNAVHGNADCDSGSQHFTDSVPHDNSMACKQCKARQATDDFWLRNPIDGAGQAMISFYHALLVAYYDAPMDLPSNHSNPVKNPSHQINRSRGEQAPASSPTDTLSDPKCPLLSRLPGKLNAKNSNVELDLHLATERQCSVCDGVVMRRVIQERTHLLLPTYVVDGTIASATGTIPVIVA